MNRYSKILLPFAASAMVLTTGCVSWRSLQPVPPSVAAGRRLARQGVAAIEVDQWAEAERLLSEAVEKAPEDPEAQRYLAEALWRRGAQDEAMQHMAIAAEFDRHDASTAVRAGEMLLATGDPKRAIRQADRAIRLNNGLATAWTLRGRAHAADGELDRALADMQRALLLSPNDAEVLLDSARLYHDRGQAQRCLATLHRLRDTTPPEERMPEILQLEAETYLALSRPQIAAERVAQAIELSGPTDQLAGLRAQTQQALGLEVSSLPPSPGSRRQ
ncbi:tetratricopeptide repeat protein [Aeoliella sp. ICT_H6.2]|uniref:Tetratricopeptide repeat protein n=1 Tax=Aeoliella straminimaris TaxID=2954799 RepID=A0A9X2JEB3_9BACT|nr:tetratricopeptide repeat protein [Aeoliella straminimaris]MCO6042461.1 tetratricopeptide repeat protein [Aeoliella straminimaris]